MPPISTSHVVARRLEPKANLLAWFEALRGLPYPALLDSALLAGELGRYSYLTAEPFVVVRSKGRRVEVEQGGVVEVHDADPFEVLQGLLRRYRVPSAPGLPPFQGGALGYFAYELGHHLERLPRRAVDDLGLPEMNVALYDWAVARDEATGEVWIVATGLPEGTEERARERLAWAEERLRGAAVSPRDASEVRAQGLACNFSREGFVAAVRAVKGYLERGDVYQVNVSQRFQAEVDCDPWDLYLRLRHVNPAPFAAYLEYPEVAVVSASPELFLRLEDGVAWARPMKGTRPRGGSREEDARLAWELRASEKDRAENVMIVDLLRNDLGRVCAVGSVEVPELFVIEEYPTVWQMVSSVRGRLREGLDAVDLLRAAFPGGSVTGAPKIRAMEIIDELELTQRGVYCGAIGYVGFNGSMQMSIPIRIVLVKQGRAYFQVGAGIVADSDPQAEYEETLHKARGSLTALGLSLPGGDPLSKKQGVRRP